MYLGRTNQFDHAQVQIQTQKNYKSKVENKVQPKIVQQLLLTPKYSVDPFHMCIGIY